LIPEKEEEEAVTSLSNLSTQYTNNSYTGGVLYLSNDTIDILRWHTPLYLHIEMQHVTFSLSPSYVY